jgi:hypothetical protein
MKAPARHRLRRIAARLARTETPAARALADVILLALDDPEELAVIAARVRARVPELGSQLPASKDRLVEEVLANAAGVARSLLAKPRRATTRRLSG